MSATEPERDPPGSPSTAALLALDSDRWARLLPHVRAALHDLDPRDVTPAVERLRSAPTSRLAGGRIRRELCELLARGGPAWQALRDRLEDLEVPPDGLGWLVEPPADATSSADPVTPVPSDTRAQRERGAKTDVLRRRLRETRADRDAWRRRAEGAEARADAAGRELTGLEARLETVEAELESARAELAAATEERSRAVERERRRRDAEVAGLREELSALRRAEQERRADRRKRAEARASAERDAAREVEQARRSHEEQPPRVVPGRPSRLPRGVAPGTTEAARALLHPGRLVLVDGYNVTLAHQSQLDLETQRTWLVRLLGTLVARRRIRAEVVFDGALTGGGPRPAGVRGVTVRFTDADVSADDDLVLAVEGTDEPVVVVTNDRELAARVAASGADVVGTRAFLGVA